jgi:hypothetical protein
MLMPSRIHGERTETRRRCGRRTREERLVGIPRGADEEFPTEPAADGYGFM